MKPPLAFAIPGDIATLTGAIIVALGNEHAGLFSNDDGLAERILAAGKATGEKGKRQDFAADGTADGGCRARTA